MLSGSSPATIATVGGILLLVMEGDGHSKVYSYVL